ncbi:MAG: hypothetical protein EOP09_02370, partial [Proteobacteria bacterium]
AKIEYSTTGANWTVIQAAYANATTNSYSWSVPTLADSNSALVRITVTDAQSGETEVDESDAVFSIDSTAPPLSITAPAVNELVSAASPYSIQFTSTDAHFGPTPIKIEYRENSSASWTLVADVASTSPYSWTPPMITSANAELKLTSTDLAGNSVSATRAFRLNATTPVVSITSPVGSDVWAGGAAKSITWTSSGLPPGTATSSFEFYNGSAWQVVSGSGGASGSIPWTVPTLNISGAKIRVTLVDGFGVSTQAISPAFIIDSTLPVVGSTTTGLAAGVPAGSTLSIQWTASDAVGLAANPISLSYWDGSATYISIANNVSNSGTYNWQVPPALINVNTKIRIQVTDKAGNVGTNVGSVFQVTDVLFGVSDIAAGINHTCALMAAGEVRCWGENGRQQLGSAGATSNVPKLVNVPASGISGLLAAGSTSAAIYPNTLTLWGDNAHGNFGNGSTSVSPMAPTPGVGMAADRFVLGEKIGCGIFNSMGNAICWGDNVDGMLGDNSTTSQLSPVTTVQVSGISDISIGVSHVCARRTDNTIYCWGDGAYGKLGRGSLTSSTVPVIVPGIAGNKVVTGTSHSCAITTLGTVTCWGRNTNGQLGDGTNNNSSVPISVTNLTNVVDLVASYSHNCAKTSNGNVYCWGSGFASTPSLITGVTQPSKLVAGDSHTCALLPNAQVQCWGDGSGYGQLGNGSNGQSAQSGVTVKHGNF